MTVFTLLVSPAGDKARRPSRHHNPGFRQADGADLSYHIDRFGQVNQGYVVGDVIGILLVDKSFVANDGIHLVAFLS